MNWRKIRLILAGMLYAVPVLAFAIYGSLALYRSGWLIPLMWLAAGCWLLAWLCWRNWQSSSAEEQLPSTDIRLPAHWTARDAQAWKVVREFQRNARKASAEELVEPQWYLQTARQLADRVAREYHPHSVDAMASLSAVEVLAASQLVLTDLTEWFRTRIPASHLITIGQWRRLGRLPQQLDAPLSAIKYGWWVVGSWLDPTRLPRYLMQEASWQGMKTQLLTRFASEFIERAGFYLIELNSGRLRAGTSAWQKSVGRREGTGAELSQNAPASSAPVPAAAGSGKQEAVEIAVAVVGQVNAGKSSLINTLLGEAEAAADILPTTQLVRRHLLPLPETGGSLTLLDTPGYDEAGSSRKRFEETLQAVQQADLVLMVLDARNPARQTDVEILRSLDEWFEKHPQSKRPPALGVLTHVDLLRPPLEWSPPYDWQEPHSPKEKSIHEAVAHNREVFGSLLAGIVPVCCGSDPSRVDGVEEYLLPAMMVFLDEARGCALLRGLHRNIDSGRYVEVFRQLWQAGRGLLDVAVDAGLLLSPAPAADADRILPGTPAARSESRPPGR